MRRWTPPPGRPYRVRLCRSADRPTRDYAGNGNMRKHGLLFTAFTLLIVAGCGPIPVPLDHKDLRGRRACQVSKVRPARRVPLGRPGRGDRREKQAYRDPLARKVSAGK